MTKLAMFSVLVVVSACDSVKAPGESDAANGSVDAAIDAASTVDAPPEPPCDLLTNSGCGLNEKCTVVIDSTAPLTGHTDCAQTGTVAENANCVVNDETGVDNCTGGTFCSLGSCRAICEVGTDTCPENFVCTHLPGIFADAALGTCDRQCDAVAQDCADSDKACFIFWDPEAGPPHLFATVCTISNAEPASECNDGEAPGVHGDCCHYVNTCAPGYACMGVYTMTPDFIRECVYVCDPTGTVGTPNCDDGPGRAPDFHCVSFFNFMHMEGMPPWYGLCLSAERWGPAQCYNDIEDDNEDNVDCCNAGSVGCPCNAVC